MRKKIVLDRETVRHPSVHLRRESLGNKGRPAILARSDRPTAFGGAAGAGIAYILYLAA